MPVGVGRSSWSMGEIRSWGSDQLRLPHARSNYQSNILIFLNKVALLG